jgi:hypothetical protein
MDKKELRETRDELLSGSTSPIARFQKLAEASVEIKEREMPAARNMETCSLRKEDGR